MSGEPEDKGKIQPISSSPKRMNETFGQAGGYFGDSLTEASEITSGVILRRIFAYLIDVIILTAVSYALATLLVILTLGLALFIIGGLILVMAVSYHTFFIGRNGATPGMSFLGLEVRDYYSGRKPSYGQAFITTAAFYLSVVVTLWIVLLVPVFTKHNRTLHDILSGTILLRRQNQSAS